MEDAAPSAPCSRRAPSPTAPGGDGTPPSTVEDVERQHIASVLKETRWRIDGPDGAARVLDMNPSTLRSRIKKLGIRRSDEPW